MKKYLGSQGNIAATGAGALKHYWKENSFTSLPVSIALAIM